jgi:hypothetical protein
VAILGLPLGASVNTGSVCYLTTLLNEVRRPRSESGPFKGSVVRIKDVRACRSLRIRIGSLAFLRRFTVLKIISLIVYWTVRYMLLF